jgi:hypothetical protein
MKALALTLAGLIPAIAGAGEVSATLRAGFPGAAYVEPYTPEARAAAARAVLHLVARPRLGATISLTPNRPYAEDGTALNVWKPSFVLGTRDGGEIGLNFWGLHTEGHINVVFTPHAAKPRLLDCRLLSAGPITYKIYSGSGATPAVEKQAALVDHHLMLVVPAEVVDTPVLVEIWPTPTTEPVAFFGCDLSEME